MYIFISDKLLVMINNYANFFICVFLCKWLMRSQQLNNIITCYKYKIGSDIKIGKMKVKVEIPFLS
jgi:hypothetical protein